MDFFVVTRSSHDETFWQEREENFVCVYFGIYFFSADSVKV